MIDYRGKTVLILGGTRPVGLASALAFGGLGARCVLTVPRGDAGADEVREQFRAAGALPPLLVPIRGTLSEDCPALLKELQLRGLCPEALVGIGPEGGAVRDPGEWSERAVVQRVRSDGWPIYEYALRLREACGRYPRYVVAVSQDSPEHYSSGADLGVASAAVLEALCRCLTHRLRGEDIRINVLRIRAVPASDEEFLHFARRLGQSDTFVEPEEAAGVVLALCSGLLDGVRGQVIVADRGATFRDDLCSVYQRRQALGL
jgi:NAD(P)-dependent dehydrogenase (short-subunit alcohol dehydrogenase family)